MTFRTALGLVGICLVTLVATWLAIRLHRGKRALPWMSESDTQSLDAIGAGVLPGAAVGWCILLTLLFGDLDRHSRVVGLLHSELGVPLLGLLPVCLVIWVTTALLRRPRVLVPGRWRGSSPG